MLLYTITYSDSNNTDLEKALDQLGECLTIFAGTCLLQTELTPRGLRKRLLPYVKNKEQFVITQFSICGSASRMNKVGKQFAKEKAHPVLINYPLTNEEDIINYYKLEKYDDE